MQVSLDWALDELGVFARSFTGRVPERANEQATNLLVGPSPDQLTDSRAKLLEKIRTLNQFRFPIDCTYAIDECMNLFASWPTSKERHGGGRKQRLAERLEN